MIGTGQITGKKDGPNAFQLLGQVSLNQGPPPGGLSLRRPALCHVRGRPDHEDDGAAERQPPEVVRGHLQERVPADRDRGLGAGRAAQGRQGGVDLEEAA